MTAPQTPPAGHSLNMDEFHNHRAAGRGVGKARLHQKGACCMVCLYQIQEQATQLHAVRRLNKGYIQGLPVMGRGMRGPLGAGYKGCSLAGVPSQTLTARAHFVVSVLHFHGGEGVRGGGTLLGYSCQKCVT